MLNEIWKPIAGYERLYEVSNYGNIKNCRSYSKFTNSNKSKFGNLINQRKNNAGYMRVRLFKDSIGKDFFVHRLVAQAFIDNPNKEVIVNHKDCNKKNNHSINLEWVSRSDNMKHAYKNDLINLKSEKREKNLLDRHSQNKKKVTIYDSKGEFLGVFESLKQASCHFGYGEKYFSNVLRKGSKKYKAKLEVLIND